MLFLFGKGTWLASLKRLSIEGLENSWKMLSKYSYVSVFMIGICSKNKFLVFILPFILSVSQWNYVFFGLT
jgi:hypothetical protein